MQGAAGSPAVDVSCPAGTPVFRAGQAGIGLEIASETKAISTRIIDARPLTPARFNNDWTIEFLGSQGAPLNDVTITSACAWMYVHNHGGPPMSTVQLSDPSTFKLGSLNLFMRGPWSIELTINSPTAGGVSTQTTRCDASGRTPGVDKVVIPVCVVDE